MKNSENYSTRLQHILVESSRVIWDYHQICWNVSAKQYYCWRNYFKLVNDCMDRNNLLDLTRPFLTTENTIISPYTWCTKQNNKNSLIDQTFVLLYLFIRRKKTIQIGCRRFALRRCFDLRSSGNFHWNQRIPSSGFLRTNAMGVGFTVIARFQWNLNLSYSYCSGSIALTEKNSFSHWESQWDCSKIKISMRSWARTSLRIKKLIKNLIKSQEPH